MKGPEYSSGPFYLMQPEGCGNRNKLVDENFMFFE